MKKREKYAKEFKIVGRIGDVDKSIKCDILKKVDRKESIYGAKDNV